MRVIEIIGIICSIVVCISIQVIIIFCKIVGLQYFTRSYYQIMKLNSTFSRKYLETLRQITIRQLILMEPNINMQRSNQAQMQMMRHIPLTVMIIKTKPIMVINIENQVKSKIMELLLATDQITVVAQTLSKKTQ